MTKEEYLALASKPIEELTLEQAQAMDQHIKFETVLNTKAWAGKNLCRADGEYLTRLVSLHFGSVETDEFLTRHNFYPNYMVR